MRATMTGLPACAPCKWSHTIKHLSLIELGNSSESLDRAKSRHILQQQIQIQSTGRIQESAPCCGRLCFCRGMQERRKRSVRQSSSCLQQCKLQNRALHSRCKFCCGSVRTYWCLSLQLAGAAKTREREGGRKPYKRLHLAALHLGKLRHPAQPRRTSRPRLVCILQIQPHLNKHVSVKSNWN